MIVHSQKTASQLNDQTVWAYGAVLKTADGRDVAVHFDTRSALGGIRRGNQAIVVGQKLPEMLFYGSPWKTSSSRAASVQGPK